MPKINERKFPSKEIKNMVAKADKILISPQITEKATDLAQKNQYVFKVFPKANKTEIKKAIEDLYKVEVSDVKIINVPKKRRRSGKINRFFISLFPATDLSRSPSFFRHIYNFNIRNLDFI